MTRQSQRTRPERRQQIGAEPGVEEAGVDQEDVADLEVDVEEVAEEDFDEFYTGIGSTWRRLPSCSPRQ